MSGARYLLRRLALAVFVLAGVLVTTFVLSRVVPNDPARLYAGARARPAQLVVVREELGLDRPLVVQFGHYTSQLLRGDLGESFRTRRAIVEDLRKFLPATMELVVWATLLAVVIGIPLGVVSAARRGRAADHLARFIAIAGVSLPAFWLALLAQLVFFGWLGWLPLGGRVSREILLTQPIEPLTGFYLIDAAVTGNWKAWRDALWHLVLPVAVLATYPVGLVARMTRAAMMEVLNETYVTAATSLGLSRRAILFRYALKNALIPTLTVLGLTFAFSITGAVLVEIVFSWPGVGKYVTDAIVASDYPVIVAVTLVVTVIYVLVNLAIDLMQALLDPRIELG